jgi:acyl-CoA thioester hydrolase
MSREQFWFFHPFRVRYSEIDGQGVVFNAHYLTYFDTTISEYFRALGYDHMPTRRESAIDFHVVKSGHRIQGAGPLRLGDRRRRARGADRQFEPDLRARDLSEGGERCARDRRESSGSTPTSKTHRPVPISKAIRERIASREKHLAG